MSVRRVRQLPAGAALLEALLERYGLPRLEVRDVSLREGAILAAERGPDWLENLPSLTR